MSRTDFYIAIDRYCNRLVTSNINPDRIAQARAMLNDFLREIDQDMDLRPELFEHPHWAGRPSPLAPPVKGTTALDCVGSSGAKVSLPTRRP